MELLTDELRRQLPRLGSTENSKDPQVICEFFLPGSIWHWYAIEFDGEDTFFGYVAGHDQELGYFSLSELIHARWMFGLTVERNLYFKPIPLSEVKERLDRRD